MILHNLQNKFRLIHKKTGKEYAFDESTYYLEYDENKFESEIHQDNLFMKMKETTKSGKVIWEDIKENDECPYCKIGKIILRPGKWGSFWACSNFPNCGFTQNIKK